MIPASRVALVTADPKVLESAGDEGDIDREAADGALRRVGCVVEHPRWDDPRTEWTRFDLIVMRSPWDYSLRTGEFLDWMSRLNPVRVVNEPPLIRWNLDKHYLAHLAAAGLPVVPTRYLTPSEGAGTELANLWPEPPPSGEIVVKPTISAGSRNTGRFDIGDPAARALVDTIHRDGETAMVQPAIASVAEAGELALVYLGGDYSHAIRKGPLLAAGGGLLGGRYTETITSEDPNDAVRAVADAAAAAIAAVRHHHLRLPGPVAYARYDIVTDDDGPLLLEAELFEPSLFLDNSAGAADRLAAALMRRLETLRPGPADTVLP